MFEPERYVRNSFSITFPRQLQIRRMANEFEDKLKGIYFQPQIIPIPDDFDPEVPRILFESEHGFSQIVVTQVSVMLNVVYSPDWQRDPDRGKAYLKERVPILFDLTDILEDTELYFCGLTTEVKIPGPKDGRDILNQLVRYLLKQEELQHAHDVQVKTTMVIEEQFFSNVTIGNYRSWKVPEIPQGVVPLSRHNAAEQGIQITSDFNDRYAFNERRGYSTSLNIGLTVVDRGFAEVHQTIQQIR